eukprot:1150130-Pelagomonas_calceolata.AAC.3
MATAADMQAIQISSPGVWPIVPCLCRCSCSTARSTLAWTSWAIWFALSELAPAGLTKKVMLPRISVQEEWSS